MRGLGLRWVDRLDYEWGMKGGGKREGKVREGKGRGRECMILLGDIKREIKENECMILLFEYVMLELEVRGEFIKWVFFRDVINILIYY